MTQRARQTAGSPRGAALVLWAAGAIMALGWWQVQQLGDLRRHAIAFLGWFTVLFIGFAALLVWVHRRFDRPGAPGERAALIAVLCWAVLFRLILLPLVPTLSDDIYRYLWDGRVQLAGVNPYCYAPADPHLAALRDASWTRINHPDIATIYPPLCQWVFRLAAACSPALPAQKAAFVLWDAAIVALLAAVLPSWGVSPVCAIVYAWHPLVVTEFGAGGHNDALGLFWLLLGLWLWTCGRRRWAAISWGVGALGKIAPAMMGLWLLARRERWPSLGWFLLTIGLGYAPFLGMLGRTTMGLNQYARHWEFNGSIYTALAWAGAQPWLARTCVLLLWGGAALTIARRETDPRRFAWWLTGLAILCSPVVEPWYVVWIVPFLCLYRSGAWLCFTGVVVLSYEVLVCYAAHGTWCLEPWAQWAQYVPLYAWLIIGWLLRLPEPARRR